MKDLFELADVDYLKELELFNMMMKEMNSTASVGGSYNSPRAFTASGEEENPESDFKYGEKVEFDKNGKPKMKQKESEFKKYMKENVILDEAIEIGGYIARSDLTAEQKMGKTIKQTKKFLEKIEKEIKKTVKLKQESGMSNENYWKSTKKDLNEMTSSMLNITRMIRDLSS